MSASAIENHASGHPATDADMEQILSSIRRIIAEDQRAMGMPLPDPQPRPAAKQAPPAPRATERVKAAPRAKPPAARPEPVPLAEPSLRARIVRAPLPQSEPFLQTRPDVHPRAEPPAAPDAEAHPDFEGSFVDLRAAASHAGQGPEAGWDLQGETSEFEGYGPEAGENFAQAPEPAPPPVRLAPAPEVDYRPREARRREAAPVIDTRLADAIRAAVNERIDEVAQAAAAARQGDVRGQEPVSQSEFPRQSELRAAPDAPAQRPAAVVGLALAGRPGEPPAALAYARDQSMSIVAPVTAARISSAFDALTQRVAAERARTMEETVTDMLRPMLAQWLDDHLPDIVERLVAEQIAILARERGEG